MWVGGLWECVLREEQAGTGTGWRTPVGGGEGEPGVRRRRSLRRAHVSRRSGPRGEPLMALRAALADENGPCSWQWDGQLARQGGGGHPADWLPAGPTGVFLGQSSMALRARLADENGPCSGQWDGQLARQGGGAHPTDRLAAGPTGPFSGEPFMALRATLADENGPGSVPRARFRGRGTEGVGASLRRWGGPNPVLWAAAGAASGPFLSPELGAVAAGRTGLVERGSTGMVCCIVVGRWRHEVLERALGASGHHTGPSGICRQT